MLRRLFTLLSAASLVLCAATVWLWGVDARRAIVLHGVAVPGGGWDVQMEGGRLTAVDEAERLDRGARAAALDQCAADLQAWQDRLAAARAALHPLATEGTAPARPPRADYLAYVAEVMACERAVERLRSAEAAPPAGPYARHEVRLGPVAAFAAVLPSAWVARRWRRAWRLRWARARWLCVRCGYDLRATPMRCPECGAERRTAA